MAEVRNPKWDALNRLKSYVQSKNKTLGYSDPQACVVPPGSSYGGKINASDTWTSKLADDQATYTTQDVTSLANVFTALEDEITSAMSSMNEYVDENDPAAKWPN